IFDGQVVAVGDLDTMEDFYVLANMLQHMAREHGTKTKTKPVIQADGRAVEHRPEPNERLALGILDGVDIAVIFGLKRGIARIEGVDERLLGERRAGVGRRVGATEIEFVQGVADYVAAVLWVAIDELLLEVIDPGEEGFFRGGYWGENTILVSGHEGPR